MSEPERPTPPDDTTPPSGRRYRLSLEFTAASDEQAQRLGMAWAGTCAAEYGTRDPIVTPVPPDDPTAPAGGADCRHEFCRYAEQIANRFPMTDPGNIDKIIDAAAHVRSLPIIGDANRKVEAAEAEAARLKARVMELTVLLNDHDRLMEHVRALREFNAIADEDSHVDRLADGGEV